MAIYDIFEVEKNETGQEKASLTYQERNDSEEPAAVQQAQSVGKGRFFSSLVARLFFLMLLAADILWALYAVFFFAIIGAMCLVTLRKVPYYLDWCSRRWLSVKRSLICGVSLFITLFSPSFGIMIACTYFLMYDKSGIEEVVPSSLQSQFKEFFKSS